MKTLNKLVEQWVELDFDKSEEKTKFKIKGLSGLDSFEFVSKVEFDSNGDLLINRPAIEFLLKKGLKDWSNFIGESGAIEFSQSNIELIPLIACKELAMKVLEITQFSEEDKKK